MDFDTENSCFGHKTYLKATTLTEPGRWLCHHGTVHYALHSSFPLKFGLASEACSQSSLLSSVSITRSCCLRAGDRISLQLGKSWKLCLAGV